MRPNAWWVSTLLVCVALTACGPKSMRAKMKEGEDQADRVSSLLDDAEKALREREPDPAERKLREADEILQRPEIATNPDAEMLKDRLHTLQPQVAQVRAEKEREELARRVAHRREVIA